MNSFLADDEARIYFLPSFAATRATKPERYNFSIVMILQLNELQFESVVLFFPPFSHFRPSTNYFDECHHIMFAVFLSSRVQHIVIITFMLAIDCIQSNHFRPLYFRLILTHIYNLLVMCFFPFNISFIHSFWWFNVEKKNLRFIAWASFGIRQNAFPDSVLMVSCHWMRADCARWHRQTTIIS